MALGPLMIDVEGLTLSAEDRELLAHPLVGGIILFSRNFAGREQVQALTAEIRGLRSPQLLIAVDQEGGRVQRFRDGFTALPPLSWLGHVYDSDPATARQLAMLAARVMAQEVMEAGVDFSFAPVLDIDRGCCEVIGDRAMHQQSEIVGALGMAYMQGMRQVGMPAIAKHFPGHGGVVGDSHLLLPEDHRSYAELLDDMQPYASLIGDGLHGVMMAHIRYTACDPLIASLSPYWMQTVLRGQLGFNGAIFSDDLTMEGASVGGSVAERAQAALQSGADMILLCNNRASVEPVLQALEGYDQPVSHGRLAAMRADFKRYAAVPRGSDDWQRSVDALRMAQEPPALTLDGGVG
jgi:beta-N-acetylhexosaminidase